MTVRKALWRGIAIATIAAIAVTGASGASSGGTITTIAGTGVQGFSGDGGPAVAAQLRSTYGVAVDRHGNVYIADYESYRVRRVSPGGTITTFAGTGAGGFSGDGGPATSARLNAPIAIAMDGQGNLYIADFNNARVRKVSPGGTITTFAGTGVPGFSGDGGSATSARLYAPHGVAVDGQGNVYIADSYNQRVRKVNPAGTITTIAGGGTSLGDGGSATSARLTNPRGVGADAQGNVYVLDESNRVRKVTPAGTITTIAGGGGSEVRTPYGVAVDGQGNVYIADFYDHRVRKVSPGGTITTLAGTGAGGFSGDGGPATSARLYGPYAVAVDGKGYVYIGDNQNRRVRLVATATAAAALTLTLGGAATQPLLAQQGVTVTAKCDTPCSLVATGSVTIVGTQSALVLSRATAKLAAGTRTLTLHCPAAEQKRFRKLLKPGRQARAVITVKAKDKAGNTSTSKRTVTVRR
jgi:streptogramin lyase